MSKFIKVKPLDVKRSTLKSAVIAENIINHFLNDPKIKAAHDRAIDAYMSDLICYGIATINTSEVDKLIKEKIELNE